MGYTTIVRSTLSHLVQNETSIRSYLESQPQRLYEKRSPRLTLLEVDSALAQWVLQKLSMNARLTGDIFVRRAANFVAFLAFLTTLFHSLTAGLSPSRLEWGFLDMCYHGEAASAPVERLEDECYRLLAAIMLYWQWDVYNVHESALLYCLIHTCGQAIEAMPGVKLDKKQITYMLCANMNRSDKQPPLIIG
jgi:hypothetical protein